MTQEGLCGTLVVGTCGTEVEVVGTCGTEVVVGTSGVGVVSTKVEVGTTGVTVEEVSAAGG